MDIQLYPFVINASDWSRALQAKVDFVLKANNFNFKNSHLEPVIEPWNFGIKASQDSTDKSTSVTVFSKEILQLNVTHTFLESLLAISETLNETKVILLIEHGYQSVF